MAKTNRQKMSKKRKTGISVLAIIVLIICGIIMIKTIQVNNELQEEKQKLERIASEYDAALSEEQDIAARKDYQKTDEYIEDEARNKMGLVYPDEILIVPEDQKP